MFDVPDTVNIILGKNNNYTTMRKLLFTLALLLLSFNANAQICTFPVRIIHDNGIMEMGDISINPQTMQWYWEWLGDEWLDFYAAEWNPTSITISLEEGKKPPTSSQQLELYTKGTHTSSFISIDSTPDEYLVAYYLVGKPICMGAPKNKATDEAFQKLLKSFNQIKGRAKEKTSSKINDYEPEDSAQVGNYGKGSQDDSVVNTYTPDDSAQGDSFWDDIIDPSFIDSVVVTQEVYKQKNKKFLLQNAKKPGVITLPSGLQYKVVHKGSGPIAKADDTVEFKYEGRRIEGYDIEDGSHTASVKPADLIKGLKEAITKMPEGSTWVVFIPYNLGFGEADTDFIPPFTTLIYKIEIVKVIKNGSR